MQLTASAPLKEMKVNEVVSENQTPSPDPDAITQEEAETVTNVFARRFYTTLSEQRSTIHSFYGHESVVNCEGKTAVGQKDISKLYVNQLPNNARIKINNMKGAPLKRRCILAQIIGFMNYRPFTQTFVLGQQGSKKFYIENDFFQYLDELIEQTNGKENGHVTNGHSAKIMKQDAVQKTPVIPTEPAPPVSKTPQKVTPKKEEKEATPKNVEKPVEPIRQQAPKPAVVRQLAPTQAPQPTAQVDVPVAVQEPPKPKTWANLVGGGSSKAPAPVQQQQQPAPVRNHVAQQQQKQQEPRDTHPQTQNADRHEFGNLSERKIYLGGITRTIVPDSIGTAETEIKTLFYQFGEVDDVHMPRKVLDQPNDTSKTAFAFITMRNVAAAQKVFESAQKDEQGNWRLKLKIDAFGFDGLATISEQKDRPFNGNGYRGRGGFQGRGGFGSRGGSRGGPRGSGGMRGGFHNQNMNHH